MTPSFNDLMHVFGRIGLLSFGGPAAQIALMHKELVEDRYWLKEKQFLGALSFCMLLPGPEAMQLATYTGWKLRGTWGGLIAGVLFVLPGAFVIFALASLYISYGALPLVQSTFLGVKAAVVAIVLQALWKVSRKALKNTIAWGFALSAFTAIFAFGISFVVIVFVAGALGAMLLSTPRETVPSLQVIAHRPVKTVAIWSGIWALPIVVVALLDQAFLLEIALFFSKLAVVTFGGAYAVLAYMTQTVSQEYGWITTAQMIDALGLAETTPGPLILVTQFVGHLAGGAQGGVGLMIVAGLLALWCTFVPCFLWIFAAAPYVDHILVQPRLRAALDGITAAVVGVILNLALWFAMHVVFTNVITTGTASLPDWQSFDPIAISLVLLSAFLLFALRLSLPLILSIAAALALVIGLL